MLKESWSGFKKGKKYKKNQSKPKLKVGYPATPSKTERALYATDFQTCDDSLSITHVTTTITLLCL